MQGVSGAILRDHLGSPVAGQCRGKEQLRRTLYMFWRSLFSPPPPLAIEGDKTISIDLKYVDE